MSPNNKIFPKRNQIFYTLKAIFGNVFTILTTITAVAGLVFDLVNEDQYGGIVSIVAFCIFLLCLLGSFIWFVIRVFKRNISDEYGPDSPILDHGCDTISMTVHYDSCGDAVTYNSVKTIQCKKLFVTHYPHRFKWSGTKKPEPGSMHQTVSDVKWATERTDYDIAMLKLKKPLVYNESTVINLVLVADDSDNHSDKHISFKMNEYIHVLDATVTLRHLSNLPPVWVKRKKYQSQVADNKTENVMEVKFDEQTKSYKFVLPSAELGYLYIFSWEHVLPK